MKFRIRYADQVVGFFIILAVALFCGIVILLGANQRWFSKNYRFRTNFESSSGVTVGTPILMKGFQVGKIERVSLNDQNTVDVDFIVYDTYYPKVRKNSLIEISVSPIGLGTQLLFHPGRGDSLIPENEFIPEAGSIDGQSIIEQDLAEIPPKDDTVTRLLANVNPLLENVNKTVVTINRTLTEVNRALAGQSTGPLGEAVAELPKTMRGVTGVVGDVQAHIAGLLEKTDALLASVAAVADNIDTATDALRDPTGLVPKLLDPKGSLKTILDDKNALYNKIVGMMDDIARSVKNLSSIVSSLNGEMPKISAILNESRTALQKVQDVLEGVKNNPLISGGVPQRAEQQSLYQSMREGEF